MNIQQILDWLKEQEEHERHIVLLELYSDGSFAVVESMSDYEGYIARGDNLEELRQLIEDNE